MKYESDNLAHHGVMGMKWGVRRYENTDGSLTASGKKHYQKQIGVNENKAAKAKKRITKNQLLLQKAPAKIQKHTVGANKLLFSTDIAIAAHKKGLAKWSKIQLKSTKQIAKDQRLVDDFFSKNEILKQKLSDLRS